VPWFPPAALPLRGAVASGGPTGAPTRSAHRPPHDLHDLPDVRLALARVDGVGQAAVDVVFQDQHGHLVRSGGHGFDLLQDLQAVRLVLHQALEPTGLSFDPAQPVEQIAAVARVAVAEVRLGVRHVIGVAVRGIVPVHTPG
jgi:hypothetical protein